MVEGKLKAMLLFEFHFLANHKWEWHLYWNGFANFHRIKCGRYLGDLKQHTLWLEELKTIFIISLARVAQRIKNELSEIFTPE